MNPDCIKAVLVVAVIGSFGSLFGWYWHDILDCLSKPISSVRFGPALLWLALTLFLVKAVNRLIFKN